MARIKQPEHAAKKARVKIGKRGKIFIAFMLITLAAILAILIYSIKSETVSKFKTNNTTVSSSAEYDDYEDENVTKYAQGRGTRNGEFKKKTNENDYYATWK